MFYKKLTDLVKVGSIIVPTIKVRIKPTSLRPLFTIRDINGAIEPNGHEVAFVGPAGATGAWISLEEARRQAEKQGHGVIPHQNLTIFQSQPWFEKVDQRFLNQRSWGFRLADYPKPVQKLFEECSPDIGDPKAHLRWKDVIALNQHILKKLVQAGVVVKSEEVDIPSIRRTLTGILIPTTTMSAPDKSLIVPMDTHFYVAGLRQPRIPFPGCMTIEQLFALSLQDVPKKIVLIGAGLSSAWAVTRFPECEFLILKREEDYLQTTAELGHWYKSHNLCAVINIDDTIHNHLLWDNSEGIVCVESSTLPGGEFTGKCIAAMGYTPPPHLPLFIRRQTTQVPVQEKDFIAPGNILTGSFIHSLYEYLKTTENSLDELGMTTIEDLSKHIHDLSDRAQEIELDINIKIQTEMSEKFCEKIKKLDHTPTKAEWISLLTSSYREAEENQGNWKKFDECLSKMNQDVRPKSDSFFARKAGGAGEPPAATIATPSPKKE